MIKLNQILESLSPIEVVNRTDMEIFSIAFDSRMVKCGSLFVALNGTQIDGHNFIEKAVEQGAIAIVCEQLPTVCAQKVCYIVVESSTRALAIAASLFYGKPSESFKVIGVTGTNGKTTVATLLYNLFTMLGYKVGLISTVRYMVADREIQSTHTTPDVLTLNALFAQMRDEGCDYCFMEVSSHSVVQDRVWGVDFDGALFTNITHDHLDYHQTFANYIKAKKCLFDNLKKGAFALYNSDDKNGSVMVQNCGASIYSFGLRSFADYKCTVLEQLFEGTLLDINSMEVWSRLIGRFNAYNMVAVYAVAKQLEVDTEELLCALSALSTVEGRFDYLTSTNGVTAIVDYAHTPDALDNIISTVGEIKGAQQRLITVVGCGGDRDRTKRPQMARIAVLGSDLTILTSDNPRTESPDSILNDMVGGVKDNHELTTKYIVISDRAQAIKMAIMSANSGDIVLVAGKGHETYQEINGVKYHFSDKEQIKNIFNI